MIKKIIQFFCLISLGYSFMLEASDKVSRNTKQAQAVFAMGCFWCAESEFRDHQTNNFIPGVLDLTVGYAGGTTPNPTYENHKGYKEAVKITYDPSVITYAKLLDIFWRNIDPFDAKGQFCDKGDPYTAVVFFNDEAQKREAENSKASVETQLKKAIVTEITPQTTFFAAEAYHQNYKAKNPARYQYYRWRCGRDARLKEIWGEIPHQ